MMKSVLCLSAAMLFLASCEYVADGDREADSAVFFRTSAGVAYRFSDFSFYDSSSHIYYFKSNHPEMEEWKAGYFAFMDGRDTLFSGNLWPMYFSSMPPGAFIGVPPIFCPDYVLRVDNWRTGNDDPRNNSRLISMLQQKGMLHSGLSVTLREVTLLDHGMACLVTVKNMDDEDLLILDPEKMGSSLFHYFTNGLFMIESTTHESFYSNIIAQSPVPADSWKMSWLTRLVPSESKTYSFLYSLGSTPPSGTYDAFFTYPGLNNEVSGFQLYQDRTRIWLGDARSMIRVQF